MNLYQRILAQLKRQYSNLGLSDKVLEGMAKMLALNTEDDEAKIETACKGVEELLKGVQSDADKRVTDAVNKAKAEAQKPESKEGGNNNEPEKGKGEGQEDAITKAISAALAPLMQEVEKLKSGKESDNRKQTLEAKLANANPILKDIIMTSFAGMSFENDEAFNTFLSGVETKVGEFDQHIADTGLGSQPKPLFGAPDTTGVSQATKNYIESKKEGADAKSAPLGGKQIFPQS